MKLGQLLSGALAIGSGLKALGEAFADDSDLGNPDSPRAPASRQLPAAKRGPAIRRVHSVGSIDSRVAHIVKMMQKGKADPQVREYAVRILSKKCGDSWCVPEKNWRGEVQAIFDHVRSKVRYMHDEADVDTFQHPMRSLEWGGGDCDDMTIVLGSLLGAVGYSVKARVIRSKNSRDWNHIYLMVEVPGQKKWMPLDASMDKPAGWQPSASQVAAIRDYKV